MEALKLAMKAGLPLIHITTTDTINIEEVLAHIAGCPVKPINVPELITSNTQFNIPSGRIFYTSNECKSLVRLYRLMVENEKTIIFVNTEKSVLQFDGGTLFPPKDLVRKFLAEVIEEEYLDDLLPTYGGLTLKDVGEVSKLTMTRDESLTPRGVNHTRKTCIGRLKGIQQVDTDGGYYSCPTYLQEWLDANTQFFKKPVHPSLIPRGLLFDGAAGTGKTAASKYIAQQFGVPLYHLDLGAMKGKYVGESEGNLIAALTQVDQVEPCVVIFDEVEKIFQGNGDSGVTSSLLSQLLWWLQEHRTQVFTVMTTNNRLGIPPELYREGRIDATMVFLGLEDFNSGYEFGKGALERMAAEVGINEVPSKAYITLNKRLKTLFSGVAAVAQVKVIQAVHELVKELLTTHKDGGAA